MDAYQVTMSVLILVQRTFQTNPWERNFDLAPHFRNLSPENRFSPEYSWGNPATTAKSKQKSEKMP